MARRVTAPVLRTPRADRREVIRNILASALGLFPQRFSTAAAGYLLVAQMNKADSISFDLSAEHDVTSLLFGHRGFRDSANNLASATTRWGFNFLSLERCLDSGQGTPPILMTQN